MLIPQNLKNSHNKETRSFMPEDGKELAWTIIAAIVAIIMVWVIFAGTSGPVPKPHQPAGEEVVRI